ncbi:MAG: hypothetical protein COA32_16990 [Fluviicola sp.]|nr:MAG: hypothetical protein COA32_16990 [Fluviicola sp.]
MNKKKLQDKLKAIGKRCQAETPPFFKKLRTVGLVIAAVGTTVVASPLALPAAVITAGGYLILGGSIMTAVSQAAVSEQDCEIED